MFYIPIFSFRRVQNLFFYSMAPSRWFMPNIFETEHTGTLFYLTTGASHFRWNRLAYKTFIIYNKRDSMSRKITAPSCNVTNKNLISTAILLNWNAWSPTHGKLEMQRALHLLLSRETVCAKNGSGCRVKWCTCGRLKYFEMWRCVRIWVVAPEVSFTVPSSSRASI
jgi:hypothetical protein